MPVRAVVVVVRARGMIAEHLNGQAEVAPWIREVRECAAVPAGRDGPAPAARKRFVPTAAAA